MERIVIIGGGATGAAVAHDLTLRGFAVTLVEKGSLLSGTSGRHHGLLHSGARYVLHDVTTAHECYKENQILRRLAPQAIEANDGLFVALTDEDMAYKDSFLEQCAQAGIPAQEITPKQAKSLEPQLADHLKGAVLVPDATMDAWRLPMHFFASAHANGACIHTFAQVDDLRLTAASVTGVRVTDLRSGSHRDISADLVINATGPWAGHITTMAGENSPVQPGPGVMVAMAGRSVHRVINRLHPAGEGDIIVPQRNQTIVGSTAWLADDPDRVTLPQDHVQRLMELGEQLIPGLSKQPTRAAWCASRPLVRSQDEKDPMRISRGFACIDHKRKNGLEGLITVVGGKATTLRAMAQSTGDMICQKTGRAIPCSTDKTPLVPYRRIMQSPTHWI